MRQYEIIITPAAENDLQEIFRYIATLLLEPQTAINLCDKIEQEICHAQGHGTSLFSNNSTNLGK